jgi:hypothetical protein
MIKILFAFLYVVFIVAMSCIIPAIMIPVFQDYGLYARDVVGFTLTITLISDIILLGFGAVVWSVYA